MNLDNLLDAQEAVSDDFVARLLKAKPEGGAEGKTDDTDGDE